LIAARISLYADPYNVVLPITSSTTIIAVIKDKSGNTIFDWDGSDVTFIIKSEVPVGGLGTLSDYAVTPVKGKASVLFTSSVAELQGTVTVEASVTTSDGLNTFTDTIDIDITWGAAKIELIPDPSSIYADGITQSTITATIQNAAGGTVTDGTHDITFIVAGEGTLIGSNPVTSTSGIATITLQSTTTAGIATVTASSPELLSDSCDVQTSGEPAGITLSATPNPMYSDDISTVTVTIVDENGVPVVPATAMTVGLTLSGTGFLSEDSLEFNNVSVRTMNYTPLLSTEGILPSPPGLNTVTCVNGVATIQLYSGSISGTCQIQAQDVSEILPAATIDVGFYTTADHILLTVVPTHIPVGGGNEGTSKLTASIVDMDGITVYNYEGDVLFSFPLNSGYMDTAKFKFVDNPSYSVPVFHGSASVYILSLNNSGDAVLKAEDDTSGFLTPDELTLYIQKTLKEPVPSKVVYDSNDKGVSFDIEVLGGNMQIGDIEVVWLPDDGEQLLSIKFDNVEVFSGSILSGEDIVITPTVLSEGISTIYLGFLEGIADKGITVIFYSPVPVSNYQLDSYTISF